MPSLPGKPKANQAFFLVLTRLTSNNLQNYSFFIRKKFFPRGLLPKARPSFDSHTPHFHRSWKQNQKHFALQQLKLLIEECKIKIKQLRRDEIKFKNKLRSVCDDSTTYTILTEKLSNHISNLTRKLKDKLQQKPVILTAERIRHASTQDSRPPLDTHPDPDRHTITTNNVSIRRKRCRRKRRKTNRKLDTTTVINLSSVQLTQDEVNLLSGGLKFCPTPTHINRPELKADISDFIRRLRLHEYFYDENNNNNNNPSHDGHNPFRVKSNWTPHPGRDASLDAFSNTIEEQIVNSRPTKIRDNLTKRERRALKRLIRREDIIIKPADKGSGTVVMDMDWYENECL